MDFAYGPLVAELERGLVARGVLRSGTPRGAPSARYKRELLTLAAEHLGPHFVAAFARGLAHGTAHPFLQALLAARTPSRMLVQWQRLEVLAHAANRVRALEVGDTSVRLLRTTVGGGTPALEEDSLVVELLAGVLEGLGAMRALVTNLGQQPRGRLWEVRWQRWALAPRGCRFTPWGASSDFARAAFALLLDDPMLSLTGLARRLMVSSRTLQRRLQQAGTAVTLLVRTARVVRAGDSLVLADRASLTSVAHACGFADSAHFSREFRALVGVQPGQFARAITRG